MSTVATVGVYGFEADTFPALLCVERDPEARHRSLVAERLSRDWGFEVTHLRPK